MFREVSGAFGGIGFERNPDVYNIGKRSGKDPHPHNFSLTKKITRFNNGQVVLKILKDAKCPYKGQSCGTIDREKVLSKHEISP